MAVTRTNREYFEQNTSIIQSDGTVIPGDRLLANDVPTEETFRRLRNAVAFVNEVEDRAKNNEQGLVKTVNGNNAKGGVTPDDGFTYAAQVKNLPTLVSLSQTISSLTAKLVDVSTNASQTEKNAYQVALSTEFTNWLSNEINSVNQRIDNLTIPDTTQLESDVLQLQSDVATIESNITSIQSDIATLQSDTTTNASDITALDARVSQNESDIAAFNPADNRFLGEIITRSYNTAPSANWVLCDGSAISRTTYADYFAEVGTTYGAGNGSTTFNVPDLRGRTVRGFESGNPNFDLGTTGGSDSVALVANNLPEHDHAINITATATLETFDAAGTTTETAAAGNGAAGSVDGTIEVPVAGNTANNTTTNDAVDVTNPYLTLFHFVKITA